MNKKLLLLSALLTISLLSACGATKEKMDHGSHKASDSSVNDGKASNGGEGHGNHGSSGEAAPTDIKAYFSFAGGKVEAAKETELIIKITDKAGEPVNKYAVNHEKLLHLIIVNHDLSYFSHIHPVYKDNGTFTVNTTFPSGGKYKVFADFIPEGGSNQTLSEWVKVEGSEGVHTAIVPDTNLISKIDGKEIRLALSETEANKESVLTYTIRDSTTKEGIIDLEPYLGAVGHVVILSEDAENYIHVHPLKEGATGPEAKFATTFPASGIYKIWGQFQHKGKVFTVPFTVDIKG